MTQIQSDCTYHQLDEKVRLQVPGTYNLSSNISTLSGYLWWVA